MTALNLMLPAHLYRENRNQHGEVTGVTYLHDRLLNWFDSGRGMDKLCRTIYENELADISHWEDNQLLQLEEDWLEVENGEDDDELEEQYHLSCEAVTREADEKRAVAKAQMIKRQAAIENLVSQCEEHIEEHTPEQRGGHLAEYMLAMLAIGALTYILL